MKKVLIALLVLVAVGIAGFVGLMYQGKGEIEKAVTEALKAQNITADSVKVDGIMGDSLILTNIKGETANATVSYSIGEVVLKMPNPECLNPETAGHPLVAEETTLKNLTWKSTIADVTSESKIGQVHVVGWKQNIGKILQIKGAFSSEENLAILLNAYADSWEAKDLQTITEKPKQVVFTKSALIKDITPQGLGQYVVTDISGTSEDPILGTITTKVASLSLNKLDMPPMSLLSATINMNAKDGAIAKASEEKLLKGFVDYISAGADTETVIKNFVVTIKKDGKETPGADIGEIVIKGKYEPATSKSLNFTLALKDSKVDVARLDQSPTGVMLAQGMLDGQMAHTDFTFNSVINLENKDSSIAIDFSVQKLGDIKSKMDFTLPFTSFDEAFKDANVATLQKVMLKNVHISYADIGFLPRAFAIAVAQMKGTPEQTDAFVKQTLDSESAGLLQFTTQANIDALKNCILNPGTLDATIALTKPVGLLELVGVAMQQPQSLPLQLICKPGKPIMESAKAFAPK